MQQSLPQPGGSFIMKQPDPQVGKPGISRKKPRLCFIRPGFVMRNGSRYYQTIPDEADDSRPMAHDWNHFGAPLLGDQEIHLSSRITPILAACRWADTSRRFSISNRFSE